MLPTIILVHGAFADSASWDRVIDPLARAGHPVIAAANPLRGLATDAAAVSDLVSTVDGPVVLAGHSYGGAVISNVDAGAGDIAGLVYVAGFAPEPGESAIALAGMFPGSTLGDALQPVVRADGTTDLYIARERFHSQFCADVPADQAARMAATQRPVTQEALAAPSGDRPLWQQVPAWFRRAPSPESNQATGGYAKRLRSHSTPVTLDYPRTTGAANGTCVLTQRTAESRRKFR